ADTLLRRYADHAGDQAERAAYAARPRRESPAAARTAAMARVASDALVREAAVGLAARLLHDRDYFAFLGDARSDRRRRAVAEARRIEDALDGDLWRGFLPEPAALGDYLVPEDAKEAEQEHEGVVAHAPKTPRTRASSPTTTATATASESKGVRPAATTE